MSKRPSHGRVALPQLGVPDYNVWYSPCGGVPFWGALSLLAFCLRNSGPPQDGVLENHQGSSELPPVRLAASTVRGDSGSPLSLFPRGHSPVPPSKYKRFPPLGENPETHGLRLAKTRSLKGGVRAVGEPDEKLANRIPGYQLGNRNPCGLE